MVTDYGMSQRIGNVKLGQADTDPFVGREMGRGGSRGYSDEVAAVVDQEVRRFLDDATREAWEILTKNRAVLDELASRLLEAETLDEKQLAEVFAGIVKQDERPVWNYGSEAALPGALIGHPVGVEGTPPTAPPSNPHASESTSGGDH